MSIATVGAREDLAVCAEMWGQFPEVTACVAERGAEEAQAMVPGLYWPRSGAQILDEAESAGARLVLMGDSDYPDRLAGLECAPVGLWVRGEAEVLAGACVTVTGSRAATEYGQTVAAVLASGLVARGVNVVNGCAFGIDAEALRAAFVHEDSPASPRGAGLPVVVAAGGVDKPFPAVHARLLDAVAEVGAIVSPLRPGTIPSRLGFLRRQRLLAALTDGLVLVEAGLRSGALAATREALHLGRPVGCVPGPVTSAASAGCHEVLRENPAARLVTDACEVLDLLG